MKTLNKNLILVRRPTNDQDNHSDTETNLTLQLKNTKRTISFDVTFHNPPSIVKLSLPRPVNVPFRQMIPNTTLHRPPVSGRKAVNICSNLGPSIPMIHLYQPCSVPAEPERRSVLHHRRMAEFSVSSTSCPAGLQVRLPPSERLYYPSR